MAQQEIQNGGAEQVNAPEVSFTSVKPQLLVEAPKANDAVSFYKAVFGAEEVTRTLHPKRKAEQETPLVLSAELKFGSFSIIVSDLVDDASDEPKSGGSCCVAMCLETEDVNGAIAKAVSAGAVMEGEVVDGEGAFVGGRVGKLKDPYGFDWVICTPATKSKLGRTDA